MARTAPRPPPDRERVLETVHRACPACGRRLRYRYDNLTVDEALRDIEKQSGLRLGGGGKNRIKVATGTLPFWQAWRQVCDAARLEDDFLHIILVDEIVLAPSAAVGDRQVFGHHGTAARVRFEFRAQDLADLFVGSHLDGDFFAVGDVLPGGADFQRIPRIVELVRVVLATLVATRGRTEYSTETEQRQES